jgi:hypothetical protein
MSARHAKQLIYATLYALVVFGIFFGVYSLFKPKPVIVDCAATPSDPSCAAAIEPVQVQEAEAFVTSPGRYTFLAKVANLNASSAAANFDYSFDIYDASGTIVQSVRGSSFLYADEVKYVVIPNEQLSVPAEEVKLTIDATSTQWVSVDSMGDKPQFSIQNAQGVASGTLVSVNGVIKNNDASSFDSVAVVAVFKDSSGASVGASYTELNNFMSNTTQNFSIIYPNVAGIDPQNEQVSAYAERR